MGLLADLLSWVDSRKRVAGRNIRDLINDPAAALENTGYQAALEMKDPSNYGPGALKGLLGMTAWHGSPHKFDKFSLDKIGTGEGAQAYGHGLYLAETPAVAQQYQMMGSKVSVRPTNDGMLEVLAGPRDGEMKSFGKFNANDAAKKRDELNLQFGNLYKTDIPDEAVARFLDWDKPLSQQAPEVQKAISKFNDEYGLASVSPDMTGKQVYQAYENAGAANSAEGLKRNISEDISGLLKQYQIPGIRYLDGGSRGAGSGTSNFVAFDPEMIRILERNGQPTGLQPWKPGEYKLRDLLSPN